MSEATKTKKQEQQERAAKARASRVEMLERQLAEARAKEAERNITRIQAKAAELSKSVQTLERQQARVTLLQGQYAEMFESILSEYGEARAREIATEVETAHGIVWIQDETPADAEARVDAETDGEQPTLFELPEEGPTPESIEATEVLGATAETPAKRRRNKAATV